MATKKHKKLLKKSKNLAKHKSLGTTKVLKRTGLQRAAAASEPGDPAVIVGL